jgi:hypothetical protein
VGGFRLSLVRTIRYFVLKPSALIGWLAGLVIIIALIAAVPLLMPSLPGLSNLRGNRDYNADLVWRSLNGDAQSRLTDGGGSLNDLQVQMETAKTKGVKLEEVSYIGGKSLPDGTSMQFYLVGIRQQPRSDIDYQPYMFTLDRDGKIAKVQ